MLVYQYNLIKNVGCVLIIFKLRLIIFTLSKQWLLPG
jgi:hypothetical protein